jgi:hypothetical protein
MSEVSSWADFKRLSSELNVKAREEDARLIFRGHASDEWSLQSTLERSRHDDGVADYYRLILRIKSEVQAYTGISWSDDPDVSVGQPGPVHFAQRSQYTICTHWNNGDPCYWSHDEVVQTFNPKAEFQQDIIYKFVLSGENRDTILNELAEYNLNAFTLFGSEESLMRTLSQREEP